MSQNQQVIEDPTSWDTIGMTIAATMAFRSKDPSTKVGAVLMSPDHRSVAVGFNGFPAGFPEDLAIWNNKDPDSDDLCKYDVVIHAEMNAIAHCPVRPDGWTLYVTHCPCVRCAAMIAACGIRRVVYQYDLHNAKRHKSEKARVLLYRAGIPLEQV